MNFYSFHIGDYLSGTAHLEQMEDLAYRRLLDLYYSKDGQIQACDAARLIRMKSESESVDLVIAEFFTISEDGKLCHARCDIEIRVAAEKSEKARASAKASHSASSRRASSERTANAMQTHSERSASNLQKTATPASPPQASKTENSERTANAMQTQSECNADAQQTQSYPQKNSGRTANADQTHSECTADAMQTHSERTADAQQTLCERDATALLPLPNTITQYLHSDECRGPAKRGTRFVTESPPPAEWVSFCQQERPELDPLAVYAGFSDYWIAKPGKEGVKLDWLATWRNWVRNQKAPFGASVGVIPKSRHSGFAERDYTKGIDPVTGKF